MQFEPLPAQGRDVEAGQAPLEVPESGAARETALRPRSGGLRGAGEGAGREREALPGAGKRIRAVGHGGVPGGRRGKNGIALPRPRFRRVEEVVAELRESLSEGKAGAEGFDEKLKTAVLGDAAEYAGEVVSAVERQRAGKGVHSWREGDLFTCMGGTRAQYPYSRDKEKRGARGAAFGVERKMTRAASETVWRLGALLGSFQEARDTLSWLGLGDVSISKVRSETLARGREALAAQESPAWDKREYTAKQRAVPEGGRRVPRTLAVQLDGTCVPAAKADTKGRKGKNGGEAGSRQLRVASMCEYEAVDAKGRPVSIPGSFSYAVMLCDAAELKGCVKKLAEARGARNVARVQCGADGEEALEAILTEDFPKAVFHNDFMHASSYLSTACHAPGIPDPDKEYQVCRGILKRHGAASAIKRLQRLHGKELEASEEASSALAYLEKRKAHMNYGWLRRNGYYIGTAHVEAAARILVARRCKQAGMHWRVKNAACVCALLARLRSAA